MLRDVSDATNALKHAKPSTNFLRENPVNGKKTTGCLQRIGHRYCTTANTIYGNNAAIASNPHAYPYALSELYTKRNPARLSMTAKNVSVAATV
jgi:hypothetical protein